jgi:hypothetical protein
MVAGIALMALSGCYIRTRPAYVVSPQPVVVSGGGAAYVPPAQATTVQPAPAQCICRQGAREICNGCDDNCNGVVDEECVR